MKTIYITCIALLFWSLTATAAVDPAKDLKAAINASLDVIFDDAYAGLSSAEKQAKIRTLFEQRYDLTVLIRRAMGRNWSKLSQSEQAQVVELIKQLVLKAYTEKMSGISRPSVHFGETVEIVENRVEVPSTVVVDGKTFNVLYRFGRLQSGWEIYDIVAENISVVQNYRQQLDDHFRRGTGKELIEKLQNLLESDTIGDEIKI